MSALCPECAGCGWVPYRVETTDGRDEFAWELCECGKQTTPEAVEASHAEAAEIDRALLWLMSWKAEAEGMHNASLVGALEVALSLLRFERCGEVIRPPASVWGRR